MYVDLKSIVFQESSIVYGCSGALVKSIKFNLVSIEFALF